MSNSLLPSDYFEDEPTGPDELDAFIEVLHHTTPWWERAGLDAEPWSQVEHGWLYPWRHVIAFVVVGAALVWAILFWV